MHLPFNNLAKVLTHSVGSQHFAQKCVMGRIIRNDRQRDRVRLIASPGVADLAEPYLTQHESTVAVRLCRP